MMKPSEALHGVRIMLLIDLLNGRQPDHQVSLAPAISGAVDLLRRRPLDLFEVRTCTRIGSYVVAAIFLTIVAVSF